MTIRDILLLLTTPMLILDPTPGAASGPTDEFQVGQVVFDAFVEGLAGASDAVASPDGRHIYVTGRDDDAVAILSRHPKTGILTSQGAAENNVAGVVGVARQQDSDSHRS